MTIFDPDALWTASQRLLSLLFSIFGLVVVGWLTLCALDRDPPMDVIQVIPSATIVHPGEAIDFYYVVDRHAVSEQRADTYLFDGAGVRWPYDISPYRVIGDKLGQDYITIRKVIPQSASPGKARFRAVLYYARPLNPIHKIWPVVDVLDDVEFDIVAK